MYARLNILSKPMQIFNTDEIGVSVVHKPGKVITLKWEESVFGPFHQQKMGRTIRFCRVCLLQGFRYHRLWYTLAKEYPKPLKWVPILVPVSPAVTLDG